MGQDKYYLFDASLVNLLCLCFTGDVLSSRREQYNSTLFRCDGIKGEQTGSIYLFAENCPPLQGFPPGWISRLNPKDPRNAILIE